jgi:cell pole-organizing protein PopZ
MNKPVKGQEPSMEEVLASIAARMSSKLAPYPPPRQINLAAVPAPVSATTSSTTPPPVFESVILPEASHEASQVKDAAMTTQPDILDLSDDVAARSASTPVAPSVVPVESQPASNAPVVRDNLGHGPSEPPIPRSVEEARRQFAQAAPDERPLLSSATSAAVDTAFNTLTQAVLVQNSRSIDDLVTEAVRPMLKTWLDDNLPAMVERLVRAEIERVSRGRG